VIRVAIIDDEQDSIESLKLHISELVDDIEVIGEAENVETGLQLIKSTKPDLVFLDINMPDGTGFDLLEQLPQKDINVIFVTAYDKHAVSAFRFSAIDFLLKPIDPELLIQAVDKYRGITNQEELQNRLFNLLENKKTLTKIALPILEGYRFVLINQIRRCESDGSYTYFYLKTGDKLLVSRSIKEYDELLTSHYFYRLHQSHLINLECMKEYKKGEGGSVILDDNTEIPVSRRKKEGFLSVILNTEKGRK